MPVPTAVPPCASASRRDRKSTRLNSSHLEISYAVFCLKKKNPSFEVNAALLSRTRVFVLAALDDDQVGAIVDRAVSDPERGLVGRHVKLDAETRAALFRVANGDARIALNGLEAAAALAAPEQGLRLGTGAPGEEGGPRQKP